MPKLNPLLTGLLSASRRVYVRDLFRLRPTKGRTNIRTAVEAVVLAAVQSAVVARGGVVTEAASASATQSSAANFVASITETVSAISTQSYPGGSVPISLWFTDISDGAKSGGANGNGEFVTLFGYGFGATRGTGTVTLGGGAVAAYTSWSDSKIVVELGSAVATGNFTVTNNSGQSVTGCLVKPDGTSNDFTVRTGTIYFVSASGSSGAGTLASPLIQSQVYALMGPGKTFYLRAGTYTGQMGYTGWADANFTIGGPQGGTTTTNRCNIVAYPGESVTLSGRSVCVTCFDGNNHADYMTFANLRMIGSGQAFSSAAFTSFAAEVLKSGSAAPRLVNNDMSCTYGDSDANTFTGMVTIGNDGFKVIGCTLRDTGGASAWNNNHGVYIQVGASDGDVAFCLFTNLRMGFVVQNHTDTAFLYTDVRVHNNTFELGTNGDCRGVTASNRSAGSTIFIYNNVFKAGVGQSFGPIVVLSAYAEIYNNTIYLPTSNGIYIDGQYVTVQGVQVKNNAIYCGSGVPYVTAVNGPSLGGTVTVANNLYYGNGAGPSADTTKVQADPLFTNAAAGDFSLQSSSPAKNAGTSSGPGTLVTYDKIGIARPQGASFDIGAYEFV